jgi:hypothetical protein
MNVNRFHVSCIQETDYRTHFTCGELHDFFMNILNTRDEAKTWFDCLKIASVPSKRTIKLCTHAHHSDRSVAAAIFASGTDFVDTVDMRTL